MWVRHGTEYEVEKIKVLFFIFWLCEKENFKMFKLKVEKDELPGVDTNLNIKISSS